MSGYHGKGKSRLGAPRAGSVSAVARRIEVLKIGDTERTDAALANGVARPECPACAKPMVVRFGRGVRFWGCTRFPICRATRALDA